MEALPRIGRAFGREGWPEMLTLTLAALVMTLGAAVWQAVRHELTAAERHARNVYPH
ncbi:hypothetical protein GCM10017772_03800 [Promicromonospora soli]|uniref:Uncharacterized protein n=1 Tax=Promicromonospora soli TaxID=2035533 RepID=A0A919FIU2_9MICO|nr:hypothetical protein GCM10017772_03800 [Promicromonospora soli]